MCYWLAIQSGGAAQNNGRGGVLVAGRDGEKGGNGVVKGYAAGVAPVVDALTMAAAHEK